jgi:hypothetical protein
MQVAPDEEYDWVVRYQSKIRLAPLLAGGVGILGVLANRVISGVSSNHHACVLLFLGQ